MRRIVVNSAKVAVATLLLGLVGCDGGGIEEGIPKDLAQGVDVHSVGADMKSRAAPPSTPAAKDAATTPPKK